MKADFKCFFPPLQDDIGSGITLLIKAAGPDGSGGVTAVLEAWNETLLHADRISVTRAQARKKFANDLLDAVSRSGEDGPAQEEVEKKLLDLSAKLPELLRDVETTTTQEAASEADVAALWQRARDLAEDPRLLDRVIKAVQDLGLVGERKNTALLYLAATSRLLPKPVNVVPKGPSSVGKSTGVEVILKILPSSAYVDYSSISPKFLVYCDDDLRHRIIYIREAAGMEDEGVVYMIRTLISEGRLVHCTVTKNAEGKAISQKLVKEGPTAFWTTTCHVSLDSELETRVLSTAVDDTPAQSKAIITEIGKRTAGKAPDPPDLEPFHALQEWLAAAGERRVIIPYAEVLAFCVSPRSVRIRRDFPALLSLIQSCAILHQQQRKRAPDGSIVASIEDYAIVLDLMQEYFSEAQQDGLTKREREAVEAVRSLCPQTNATPMDSVSLSKVAEKLGVCKSSASRRLIKPTKLDFVRNLQKDSGRAGQYLPGEAVPDEICMLPTVEKLLEFKVRADGDVEDA